MSRNKRPTQVNKIGLDMVEISPKTENQGKIIRAYGEGKNLVIYGSAGTGKTFLACNLAMKGVLKMEYEKVVICRSAVPTRDMGFMPGSLAEKQEPYETPYKYVFSELFSRGDAYEMLKKHNLLEFSTSSYLRGLTIRDSVIVVDEVQSWSWHEIDSIMTRVGQGSRIVLCGDLKQSDLKNGDRGGFSTLIKLCKDMPDEFATVEMNSEDIIRSSFLKSYIMAKERNDIS